MANQCKIPDVASGENIPEKIRVLGSRIPLTLPVLDGEISAGYPKDYVSSLYLQTLSLCLVHRVLNALLNADLRGLTNSGNKLELKKKKN